MTSKDCPRCKEEKSLDQFGKDKKTTDGFYYICTPCRKLQDKERYAKKRKDILKQKQEYYSSNKEDIKLKRNLYYKNNKEACNISNKNWYLKNPEYEKQRSKRRYQQDKNYYISKSRKRTSNLQKSFPKWANLDKIKEIYLERDRLTRETGVEHHVDHIIPIKGKLVSGLHVENNLRVITAKENLSKHSKFIEELL